MSAAPFLRGFSALLPSGIHSPTRREGWKPNQDIAGVRRDQVLDSVYPSFGKLELPDRLAFSAASVLFSEFADYSPGDTGISLGIRHGSISTDRRYLSSLNGGFPSPAIFSATLPSSPVADIAIYYKISGPVRVVAGAGSLLDALRLAQNAIRWGKAESMLVVHVVARDRGGESDSLAPSVENAAMALFLSSRRATSGPNRRLVLRTDQEAAPNRGIIKDDIYLQHLVEILHVGKGAVRIPTPSRACLEIIEG